VSTGIDEKNILFALRPEKTFISFDKPDHQFNWAKGKVDDVAYLGGHTQYYVRLKTGKIVQCFLANTERRSERPLWEDDVYVSWNDDGGMVLRV
jgi:putrescine transport system ATP-binding protein